MVWTLTRVVVRNGKLFPAAASGAERKGSQTQPLFLTSRQDLGTAKASCPPCLHPTWLFQSGGDIFSRHRAKCSQHQARGSQED